MDGVTILNEVIHYSSGTTWMPLCGVFALAFGLVGFVIFFVAIFYEDNEILFISLSFICAIAMTCGGWFLHIDATTYAFTEYQCTISDEVNFNELTNKYEILGHEGQIWSLEKIEEVK